MSSSSMESNFGNANVFSNFKNNKRIIALAIHPFTKIIWTTVLKIHMFSIFYTKFGNQIPREQIFAFHTVTKNSHLVLPIVNP